MRIQTDTEAAFIYIGKVRKISHYSLLFKDGLSIGQNSVSRNSRNTRDFDQRSYTNAKYYLPVDPALKQGIEECLEQAGMDFMHYRTFSEFPE